MKTFSPEGWAEPRGYTQVLSTQGRQVFVAGQIGWNPRIRAFEAADIVGQAHRMLANLVEALASADARPDHLATLTWYVTDMKAYADARDTIIDLYREIMGAHLPTMTLVEVTALLHPQAVIELDAIAVVPPSSTFPA